MRMKQTHVGVSEKWYSITDNKRYYLLVLGINHDEIILFDFGNHNTFIDDINIDFMKYCGRYNFENKSSILSLFQNKFPELLMNLEVAIFKSSI